MANALSILPTWMRAVQRRYGPWAATQMERDWKDTVKPRFLPAIDGPVRQDRSRISQMLLTAHRPHRALLGPRAMAKLVGPYLRHLGPKQHD